MSSGTNPLCAIIALRSIRRRKEHEWELAPPFPGRPAQKVIVTASWQRCSLELRETNLGLANYGTHQLFLSEDGSQLVDLVETHSTYGNPEQRLVFDKAP